MSDLARAHRELQAQIPQRRARLRQLGLDRPDEEFDRFAQALGRTSGIPGAMAMANAISSQQLFTGLHLPSAEDLGSVAEAEALAAAVGRVMPLEHGYCPETMNRKVPLTLPDVCAKADFAGNEVVDLINIRTYLGVRLMDKELGIPLMTICVVGREARPMEDGQRMLAFIKERERQAQYLLDQRIDAL
ncbi:GAF domain-containing protein [Streptomyces sp. NBC_00820]|uniref:GAF domain-containing protein n=1 Tax=Streptomyces sp. NBC_00820 TaxID=2975842 RepID=UPI002ED1D599|nr:GAF domain-containing protein [Streptomyces sp. NBC_00820]